MRPAVFLDRDGTVTEPRHYPSRPEDLVLQSGVAAGIKLLRRAGLAAVLVTNQSGLARGYFDGAKLAAMHAHLDRLLTREGTELDSVEVCPHHPDGVVRGLTIVCGCRKPAPGMLLNSAARLDLDLGKSWMVGDAPSDVQAGQAAGCRTVLVGQATNGVHSPSPDVCFPTTAQALHFILSQVVDDRRGHR
jgi:D-glycero-D-manno-heptose 1,7-bisphosphate phosphatase